jgi:hypothetical protein
MEQEQPDKPLMGGCLVTAVAVFVIFYIYLLTHLHPNAFIVGSVMIPIFIMTIILMTFGLKYIPRYKNTMIPNICGAIVVLAFLLLFGALPVYLMTLGWSQLAAYSLAIFIWLALGLIPLTMYGLPPGGFTEHTKEDQERYKEWWNRKFGDGERNK